jgi:chorismate dehydratase
MRPVRLGAVTYLNARPLVHGLERHERFAVRFDVPATCATLLHRNEIDVGLVPSIEYLARPGYRFVPGAGVVSHGSVASVALFSSRPIEQVRSIALDASSRTSAALTRVLCERRFGIRPRFETAPPDLDRMLAACDAALLIGDIALYVDHVGLGLRKIDLGEAWTALTGLPFVWAAWVGRADALDAEAIRALQDARASGEAALDRIARDHFRDEPEKMERAVAYLRENIQYRVGAPERAGLQRFFEAAAEVGVVEGTPDAIRYYAERVA